MCPAQPAKPAKTAKTAKKREAKPGQPGKRRTGEETRRLILAAAQRRLTAGGPEAIRLQDIARDVGVSHPAILHHFGSRDGLLEALERHALDELRRDLLAHTDEPAAAILDRVSATLGDAGHARLLAWQALSGRMQGDGDGPGLLRELTDAFHAEGAADARAAGRPEPAREDAAFATRLAAVAMFGEALIGPALTRSAGLEDDEAVKLRFRRWLGRLLEGRAPSTEEERGR